MNVTRSGCKALQAKLAKARAAAKMPKVATPYERLPGLPHLYKIYDAFALGDLAQTVFAALPDCAEVSFRPARDWVVGAPEDPDVCFAMCLDFIDYAGCCGPAAANAAMGRVVMPVPEPPSPAPREPEVIPPPRVALAGRLPGDVPAEQLPPGGDPVLAPWALALGRLRR